MSAASGIQRLTRPLSGQIGAGRVYRDLRSRVGRRNPDFPAPEGPIFDLSARLWIIPKKHAPMFTREAYAPRHHRQRSPRRWWLRAVALPPERLRSNGMLSDQGKRRQARKRPAELAAMAPKKRAYVSGAAAAYDTQEKDLITKTRKIIAASKRALRDAEAVLKRR